MQKFEIKNCCDFQSGDKCLFFMEGDPYGGMLSSFSHKCSFYKTFLPDNINKIKPDYCTVHEVTINE